MALSIGVGGLHHSIVHTRHRLDLPIEQARVELGEGVGIVRVDLEMSDGVLGHDSHPNRGRSDEVSMCRQWTVSRRSICASLSGLRTTRIADTASPSIENTKIDSSRPPTRTTS